MTYIAHAYEDLCEDFSDIIRPLENRVSALATILRLGWSPPPTPSHTTQRTVSSLQKIAVEQNNKTIVTPTVYKLCQHLFPRKHLRKVSFNEDPLVVDPTPPKLSEPLLQHGVQAKCEWVKESRTDSPHHYNSVMIDGVQYDVSTGLPSPCDTYRPHCRFTGWRYCPGCKGERCKRTTRKMCQRIANR